MKRTLDISLNDVDYVVDVEYDLKYVDDSFDHEFGTESCGHYEARNIHILSCISYDEDGEPREVRPPKEMIFELEEVINDKEN
jgi:hypothetical protein